MNRIIPKRRSISLLSRAKSTNERTLWKDRYGTKEIFSNQSENDSAGDRVIGDLQPVKNSSMLSSFTTSAKDVPLSGSEQTVLAYPPTPPPPGPSMIDPGPNEHSLPKRHSCVLADWSIPPTMELSPNSLTSSSPDLSNPSLPIDDALLALRRRRSVPLKRRYRSLSFSTPLFSQCSFEKPVSLSRHAQPLPRKSIWTKYSALQRLRKRRRFSLIKREKGKSNDERPIRELLTDLIERVEQSERTDSKASEDVIQPSPPLSFHSIHSPASESVEWRNKLATEIIQELIRGAKGLDKLSCSVTALTGTMETFLRLPANKQSIKLTDLRKELEKKCPSQFDRAQVFCTRKIQYFLQKHSILSLDESIEQISSIVQYFYLFILALNCRKQQVEFESILSEILLGEHRFDPQSMCPSSMLTTLIENFILHSSFVNDYVGAQPLIIDQIEYALPWIRNLELENEILQQNDALTGKNPFVSLDDLNTYLNECEHLSPSIPPASFPVQHYYPSPSYYYHYYHHPSIYSNASHPYHYSQSSAAYGTVFNTPEQGNYYYQSSLNSTHAFHRSLQTNMPRMYPNAAHERQ